MHVSFVPALFSMGLFFYCSILRRYVYGAFLSLTEGACHSTMLLCSPLSLGQLAASAVRRCRSAHRRPVFPRPAQLSAVATGDQSAANRDFTCLWSYHQRTILWGAIYRHVLRTRDVKQTVSTMMSLFAICGAGADGDCCIAATCKRHAVPIRGRMYTSAPAAYFSFLAIIPSAPSARHGRFKRPLYFIAIACVLQYRRGILCWSVYSIWGCRRPPSLRLPPRGISMRWPLSI